MSNIYLSKHALDRYRERIGKLSNFDIIKLVRESDLQNKITSHPKMRGYFIGNDGLVAVVKFNTVVTLYNINDINSKFVLLSHYMNYWIDNRYRYGKFNKLNTFEKFVKRLYI